MQSKLVSVIIPVYNCELYLIQCVDSVTRQTYSNLQILICDDGSTDNSKKIIEEFKDPRIVKFYNKKNIGNVKTINYLFEKATGDLITFQDADDWSDYTRIEKQVKYLELYKSIQLCGTDYRYVTDSGKFEYLYDLPSSNEEINNFITINRVPPFCPASCMFRKELLNHIGGYRMYFDRIGCADFDWLYRVIELHSVANICEVLYYYRKNYNSFTLSYSTDTRKYISHKIAFYLYEERKKNGGIDSIMSRNSEGIRDFINANLCEFKLDPSLNYRMLAFQEVHRKNFMKSILYLLIAILKNIHSKKNYSLAKYVIWKILINRNYDKTLLYQN